MRKVVVLIKENIQDRKGSLNAIINRIHSLSSFSTFSIDCYNIKFFYSKAFCLFHGIKYQKCDEFVEVEGLKIQTLWVKISLMDSFRRKFLRIPSEKLELKNLQRSSRLLGTYDIITSHSRYGGIVAKELSARTKKPFFITWHGTDIHTYPFINQHGFYITRSLLQDANCNFFVSNALMNTAKQISESFEGEVLYNGYSSEFKSFSSDIKSKIRKGFNVSSSVNKIILFCGNLIAVKNVLILSDIFQLLVNKMNINLEFWVIGDGEQRQELEDKCKHLPCKFWGNQPVEKIPLFMNCADVLVVPSINEGLPLVSIEALACGMNVVGSNVGGIPEVIGKENVFDLNDSFVYNITSRIIEMLSSHVKQPILPYFSWERTAIKEVNIYKSYL